MKELGAEEDLKTFASTFDGVKFRKGTRQPSSPCAGIATVRKVVDLGPTSLWY